MRPPMPPVCDTHGRQRWNPDITSQLTISQAPACLTLSQGLSCFVSAMTSHHQVSPSDIPTVFDSADQTWEWQWSPTCKAETEECKQGKHRGTKTNYAKVFCPQWCLCFTGLQILFYLFILNHRFSNLHNGSMQMISWKTIFCLDVMLLTCWSFYISYRVKWLINTLLRLSGCFMFLKQNTKLISDI